MNHKLLAAFTPGTQRVLRFLAGKPEDAANFYNRLTIFHAGLRVGVEILGNNAQMLGNTPEGQAAAIGASQALGASAAIECCMNLMQELHPSLGKMNESNPKPGPDMNGGLGKRVLDLD